VHRFSATASIGGALLYFIVPNQGAWLIKRAVVAVYDPRICVGLQAYSHFCPVFYKKRFRADSRSEEQEEAEPKFQRDWRLRKTREMSVMWQKVNYTVLSEKTTK